MISNFNGNNDVLSRYTIHFIEQDVYIIFLMRM